MQQIFKVGFHVERWLFDRKIRKLKIRKLDLVEELAS